MNERFELGMSLYTNAWMRKYVNGHERQRFIAAAQKADHITRTLCLTLVYTGCRISEALELTAMSIQMETGIIAIRSLKKRNQCVIREVPVPAEFIEILSRAHDLKGRQRTGHAAASHLWPYGRTWGWRQVKAVMQQAGISGAQATPKGLRHGFGIHAIQSGVPLNLVQKWLGHSQISTTAIYANAVGPEEVEIAERMWG